MSPRTARKIREGIILARQVMRKERLGPRKFRSALTVDAYYDYKQHHDYWPEVRHFSSRIR